MFNDLLRKNIKPDISKIEQIQEMKISGDLKLELTKLFYEEEKGFVNVSDCTTVIKTDKNYVFFPNQYYYLAIICKDYAESLYEYCNFFDKKIRNSNELNSIVLKQDFTNIKYTELFENEDDLKKFTRFLIDENYRPGKKFINGKEDKSFRGTKDIFGSCILKMLPLPDASSGYFGNIVYYLSKRNNLFEKLEKFYTDSKVISSAVEQNCNFTPTQTIYYGVPGSGKSHKIDEETKGLPDEQKIRVVFHPEYTNADFVGQILPKVKNGSVEYEFKPGPFTKILYRAYHNYNTPYCLIIEEINRGNAAAIFGDVFQLLDRIKKGDTPENINGNTFGEGWSKYFVENEFINNYLRSPVEYSKEGFTENHDKKSVTFKSGITFSENTGIRLPPNLSIYATMNTSDQNVFTLDNAFQRRWEMELVQNVVDKKDENGIKQMNAKITVNNQSITWKDFQTQINSIIGEKSNEGGLSSMEDKRLGCWFIKAENGVIDEKHFANKVLKYLWDDAFKFCHQEIFESDIKNFEELQNRFLETGFDIFSENCGLKNYLSNNQSESESQSNPVNPQDSEPSEENSEQ